MKKCKKKYTYGGKNKPLQEQYNDYNQYLADLEDWEKNNVNNFSISNTLSSISNLLSLSNFGVSEINSMKTYNKDKQKFYNELQPKFKENNPVLNNIPMYAKYGINNIPEIEAESGEFYTDTNNNLLKIKDSAPTHEEGGVDINNAKKVLSATLKISPEHLKLLTGVDTDKKLNYSKALEEVSNFYKKPLKNLKSKINDNLKQLEFYKNDEYLNNSLELNSSQYDKLPNEQKTFDMLFKHQELTKLLNSIPSKKQFGNGGPNEKEFKGKKYRKVSTIDDNYNYEGTDNGSDFYTKHYSKKSPNAISGGKWTDADTQQMINYLQNGVSPEELVKKGFNSKEFFEPLRKYYKPIDSDNVYREPFEKANIQTIDYKKMLPNTPKITDNNPLPLFIDNNTLNNNKNTINKNNVDNTNLKWYDIAGELLGLGEDRISAKYNPVEFNKIKLKLLNPTPALEQGKRDYNSILNILPNNGSGMGNLANVFQSKYNIDNQILGDYENKNSQIRNQEEMYNANVGDRQSSADQQSREVFEQKYLGSLEAYRQQKMTNLNSIFDKISQNKRFNIEKQLLEKLTPNFNMGDYNGKQRYFATKLLQSLLGSSYAKELLKSQKFDARQASKTK